MIYNNNKYVYHDFLLTPVIFLEFYQNEVKMYEECGRTTFKMIMGSDVFIGLCDPETIEVRLFM